jgi:Uma2 family endonuclease
MSDDDFFELCQLNRGLRVERASDGEMVIMPPAGGESGGIEFRLGGAFYVWAETDGTGKGFSPSTGFRLPNGAIRSPDLAWVLLSRWERLSPEERRRFPQLCPDFIAEVRSENDSLSGLQAKMVEYIDNGARLGWLIDPLEKKVYVYRPGTEVERLDDPQAISGDPVLPGFTMELGRLWL